MSAAVPEGRDRPVQLGALLVQRGVLTEEQLTVALAEQRETGRPLGEVIVRRGFAPGPIVAQALATQHGGMVKTEYGYATGWSDGPAAASAAATPAPPPAQDARDETIRQLRDWAAKAQAAIAARDTEIERLRDLAAVPVDTAELDAARAEVARLQAELESAESRTADVVAHSERLQAKLAEPPAEDPRVAELTAAVAELRTSVAADRESLAAAERKLANASSRAGTLAARVAEQDETIEELRAALEATPASRWAQAETHLVFARGGDGYELVERPGPPPAVGATVEGGIVSRVGAAPWPGVDLPCAYLVD